LKFPAVALQTYNRLKANPLFLGITDYVLRVIRSESSPIKRAKAVHEIVEDYAKEMSNHPLVMEHSGCKKGCSGCCHTEVSVTPDEAILLAKRVQDGINIDWAKLHLQKTQIEQNKNFYELPYELRGCIFLGDEDQCRVYDDRPSVCRTNMVIGDASQCSTKDGQMQDMRLVKTEKADMAIIGAFMLNPSENDLLPRLVWQKLDEELGLKRNVNSQQKPMSKSVSKDQEL
jgi:Fe-S-cluster containining protein